MSGERIQRCSGCCFYTQGQCRYQPKTAKKWPEVNPDDGCGKGFQEVFSHRKREILEIANEAKEILSLPPLEAATFRVGPLLSRIIAFADKI